MSILNIVCPICTELFVNADDICSTNCGHVFHFACMEEWRRHGRSCPKCNQLNPTSHKLFLSFDDTEDNLEKIEQELKLKLQTSNEQNAVLLDQKNETEFNFLQLQEQYTTSEQARKNLEEKIRDMCDSEQNFLHLQKQYTESAELIKQLQEQIKEISIENERKIKELRLKCLENESLKAALEAGQNNFTDSILSDKIRILEQKLKHISAEFEKEITTSTQLSIEKMKLQSYINHMNLVENAKNTLTKHPNKNNFREFRENQRNGSKTNTNAEKSLNKTNFDPISSVFIKDLPLGQLVEPLENTVIELATKMSLSISANDLVKVNLLECNKEKSMAQISVQFKSKDLKVKFLNNKNHLKNHLSTSSIKIIEYMDDQLHLLFTYAKEKLRNNGFNHIFCKNNQILAKKHRSHPRIIRIHSKAHVDSLRNKPMELEATASVKNTENVVDENYYQLSAN